MARNYIQFLKIHQFLALGFLSLMCLQVQAQNVYVLQPAGFCPPTAGAGTLSGNSCFDIALGNDNANGCGALSGRTSQQANFTLPATHTQTYTFTPSGTVSNVRFVRVNTNGNVVLSTSGGNSGNNISTAVTGTVNFNPALNALAAGTTATTALTASIYAVYNNNAVNDNNPANDRSVKLNVQVKDCACCGAQSFVSDVSNQPSTNPKTWLTFMCHNLGADQSLDPNTYVVGNADGSGGTLGYIYQWGRTSDGHQLRNSAVSSGSTTPSANFLTGWSPSSTAWGDGTSNRNVPKGVDDPCPAGYKVPSILQWSSLFRGGTGSGLNASAATANTWTLIGNGFKIGDNLYLPRAGSKDGAGALNNVGTRGSYWATSPNGSGGHEMLFISNSTVHITSGANNVVGNPIRCVAE